MPMPLNQHDGKEKMGYQYIIGCIFFTVYGQLVIKWRITGIGSLPDDTVEKIRFLLSALFDPYIISGFLAAILASLFWMASMTRFDLSYAYPFMSLSFVLVLLMSALLFHEPVDAYKITGMGIIVIGIFVSSRSLS
jgi:multidrug transporter EmrE-like cation transporter